MHNYVDVSFGNVAVAFFEGNGIFQETLVYRWVKIVNFEYDEFVVFWWFKISKWVKNRVRVK